MRLNEIVKESKKVNEAPMGMLSRAGRGIAAKLGHKKSQGALDTGKTANAVRGEYDTWLGSTGESPSAENVIAFLKHKGWPTQGALTVLQGGGGPNTQGPMDPNDPNHADPSAAGGAAGAADQTQAKPGMMQKIKQKAGAAADAAANKLGQMKGQFQAGVEKGKAGATDNPQPQGRIDPTGDINTQPAAGDTQAPAQTTPAANTQQPDAAAAARAEKLNKLRANMAPVGITGKGNKARKRLGQVGKAKQQAGSGSQGVLDLNSIQFEDSVPNNLVDKALLRAVQDARRMGIGIDINGGGQGASGADNYDDQDQGQGQSGSGGQSAVDTFKQAAGLGGKGKPGAEDPNAEKKGSLNINQLAQLLPNVNPSQLRRASAVVLQGGKLNQQMLGTLGQAFGEVLKADPQTTMKVMRLLKQVEA